MNLDFSIEPEYELRIVGICSTRYVDRAQVVEEQFVKTLYGEGIFTGRSRTWSTSSLSGTMFSMESCMRASIFLEYSMRCVDCAQFVFSPRVKPLYALGFWAVRSGFGPGVALVSRSDLHVRARELCCRLRGELGTLESVRAMPRGQRAAISSARARMALVDGTFPL